MERLEKSNFKISKALSVLLGLFAFVLILLLIFFDQYACSVEALSFIGDSVILSVVIIVSAFAVYLFRTKRLSTDVIVLLIFCVGFALRLAYIIEYGYFELQHDVESLESSGHLSYIYRLSVGKGLPDTNDWQFSHPPLHHIIAAGVVWVSRILGFSNDAAFENIQLLTCLYSTLIMYVSFVLFKEFGLKGKFLVAAFAIVAFHPTFSIFAGSINNDCLLMLLSLTAILFLVKWCKKKTFCNAALIGIFTGLAMMTKFSGAIIALVVAITVIFVFIKGKLKNLGLYVSQTALFLCTMLPLGLWFQVRNMILFAQPLGYVAPISASNPLYIGDVSFIERFILPFSTKPVGVFVDVWEEHNIWVYLLRNSLFNEYDFGNVVIAFFAVVFNFVLIVFSIVGFVYSLKKKNVIISSATFVVGLLWLVEMVSFIYLNIKCPFGCTMDFRYIPLTVVCGAAFIGQYLQKFSENSSVKTISTVLFGSVSVFCVLGTLIFL